MKTAGTNEWRSKLLSQGCQRAADSEMDQWTNKNVTRFVLIALLFLTDIAQAQYPLKVLDDGCVPTELFDQADEQPVRRFKKQAMQSVSVSGGWLGATRGNDLSSSFFETSIGLGVPLGLIGRKFAGSDPKVFSRRTEHVSNGAPNILGITPSFRVDFIDAAPGIDVPAELFETGVNFFYRKPINDRWSAMAIVRPSVRSDFTTRDEAFRIFGLGLLNWDYKPDVLSLSFGAVYLDRADLPLLPAVGLTWAPKPTSKLDLRFPQSKLAFRLAKDGSNSETWSFVTAGIGGNTWAVTRASGLTDELSLRDVRLMFGLDHLTDGGGGWFAELGYAFNRRIEYESTDTERGLSHGILLQAGWRY